MTQQEWDAFSQFRDNFKNKISEWNQFASQLIPLQKAAANKDTPNYPIENPIVYNTALDEITQEDSIKLIVIGDNPGKDEQLNKNLNSTLSNTGYFFADYYRKTGLDPYLSVSIVLHETGCKWNCSSLVTDCNNIGGMRGGEKQCGSTGYRAYDSLEEGINGYLDMLYNNYYKEGLTTPELINPKYAASTTWSTKINNYINEIRAS